jgi:hypothetical protein
MYKLHNENETVTKFELNIPPTHPVLRVPTNSNVRNHSRDT